MPERKSVQTQSLKAVDVCRHCEPGDDARLLLRDDLTADAYLTLLKGRQLYQDALSFTVHLLPKREAIWWGCLCIWKMCRPEPKGPEVEALRATVHWVLSNNEDSRQAAGKAGKAAGPGVPAGSLALAAFWTDGSMAPPGLPDVAAPPLLAAKTVAAALDLAIARADPSRKAEYQQSFLHLATEVANGVSHWEPPDRGVQPGTRK